MVDGRRYIVCLNEKQARKDAADRQAIIESLEEKLKTNPKSLVGNKGYRKYLKLDRETVAVNQEKIEGEARYDGKWVLKTNTTLTAEQVALKYKELWQVEQVFRDMKSVLDTRPIFHRLDETIRGHVFCSFLALVLRKELDRRLVPCNIISFIFEKSMIYWRQLNEGGRHVTKISSNIDRGGTQRSGDNYTPRKDPRQKIYPCPCVTAV
jgi:hypothetical protein